MLMEEKYRLEKEYRVPYETFREAYKEYQKKFVRKKSIFFMVIFLILAGDFVYAAVKAPENRLVYLLIVICIAMAFREWYNPRRIFRNVSDTVREMGETLYRIAIAEDHLEISTVEEESVENYVPDENNEDFDDEDDGYDPLPEATEIPFDDEYDLLEYDRFFLILQGKRAFYILPKEGFSEEELEAVRSTRT